MKNKIKSKVWNGVICPICRKDFYDCPHSIVSAEERYYSDRLDDKIRKIVQQEIKKYVEEHSSI